MSWQFHAFAHTLRDHFVWWLAQNHDDIALIQLDRDLGIEPVHVDGWQAHATVSAGSSVDLAGFGVTKSLVGSPTPQCPLNLFDVHPTFPNSVGFRFGLC